MKASGLFVEIFGGIKMSKLEVCLMAVAIILTASCNSVSGLPYFPENNTFSGWYSFLNLTGCHIGNEVSGLSRLKEYFHRFGYIHGDPLNYTDTYDELLEIAVKRYQAIFNLEVTGTLDLNTLNQIIHPRCGVPDIVNGTTTMKFFARNSDHLHTVGHYSFFPYTPRWRKKNLSYFFSTKDTNISSDDLRTIFHRAFARWSAVTPLTFTETQFLPLADIKIGFKYGDHGDGQPFDGYLGTLAHAFSPPGGIFHLDAAEPWVITVGDQTGIDLESVAVHEIGHLLGLGHSSNVEAIMYPSIGLGTRRVELKEDDIQGIQKLYGRNPNNSQDEIQPDSPTMPNPSTEQGTSSSRKLMPVANRLTTYVSSVVLLWFAFGFRY